MLRFRDHALLGCAKPMIPVSCNQPIEWVPDKTGDNTEDAKQIPGKIQQLAELKDGVRFNIITGAVKENHRLNGLSKLLLHLFQSHFSFITLQTEELDPSFVVMPFYEPDGPPA